MRKIHRNKGRRLSFESVAHQRSGQALRQARVRRAMFVLQLLEQRGIVLAADLDGVQ